MNETKTQAQPELQLVELGDAKEVTLGDLQPHFHEDNPDIIGKFPV